jgi:crossover junction endodeoxyribonuclease RusA
MMLLTLPYPPSVNGYWSTFRGRQIISKAGRLYVVAVQSSVLEQQARARLTGRLHVNIWVYPPDRRRRDLDNVCKATFDALAKAGVYEDDSQIDKFSVERCGVYKDGKIEVEVRNVE